MNSMTKIKKNFSWFYYCKSTALIVPILFLFLEEQLGLTVADILLISGIYYLLPMIFELPFGMLADKFGQKKILSLGLILQIISCAVLIFIDSVLAYHLYLISIAVAQCCYSGADMALVKSAFVANHKSNTEFQNFVIDLESRFYFVGILFLIIGCIAYFFAPKLAFVLQIILFATGLLFLQKLPECGKFIAKQSVLSQIAQEKNRLKLVIGFTLMNKAYLAIWLIGVIFGSVVLINHKTIQSQIASLGQFNVLITLGVSFVLGNIASSLGAKYFLKFCQKMPNFQRQLAVLIVLFAISYALLSTSDWFILGFLLLCVFKASFRPFISAELTNRIPFQESIATALSMLGLFAAVITSLIHIGVSFFYQDVVYGNWLVLAVASALLVVLFVVQYKSQPNWSFVVSKNPLTKKINAISYEGNQLYFDQVYPTEHKDSLVGSVDCANWYFNATDELKIINKNNQVILRAAYYGSVHLSDIQDSSKTYEYCDKILSLFKNLGMQNGTMLKHYRLAQLPTIQEIFHDKKNIHIIKNFLTKTIIHGDLHPDNIMVFGDDVKIIDWDLSGVGYYWFDVLTLLSHPRNNIDTKDMFVLLNKYLVELDDEQWLGILMEFVLFKKEQLLKFSKFDKKLQKLSKDYMDKWRYFNELLIANNDKM